MPSRHGPRTRSGSGDVEVEEEPAGLGTSKQASLMTHVFVFLDLSRTWKEKKAGKKLH